MSYDLPRTSAAVGNSTDEDIHARMRRQLSLGVCREDAMC